MSSIIDLTHQITAGMPVWPGDPPVTFTQIDTISKSGYNVSQVCLGTHTGTHVDVPHHAMLSDKAVESIPMDALVGWADVLDLTDKKIGKEITAADLDEFTDSVHEGARIILRTGWSKRFGEPEFFTDYPGISEGAAAWMVGRKIKTVAVEQPSIDIGGSSTTHRALLSVGIVIIESIANLHLLTQDRVYMVALPLNFVGLDGSSMRIVAIEGLNILP